VQKRVKLGEILLAAGAINQKQLEQALSQQKVSGKRLGETLIDLKYITEQTMLMSMEKQMGIPYVYLPEEIVQESALKAVPLFLAERYNILPIRIEGNNIVLAMNDPTNFFAIDDVRMVSGYNISPVLAKKQDILDGINKNYGVKGRVQEAVDKLQETPVTATIRDIADTTDNAPIINIVNSLLEQAVNDKASDIHIEPEEDRLRVRFREDGVLREVITFPKSTQAAILSRIKIMAEMDIAEKRLPQDGRIKLIKNKREIDIRVSTLPTILGEKVVMRILDKESMNLKLSDLAFTEKNMELYKNMMHSAYGMILVTGPTGSGKSTTLYSTLMEINSITQNIITVEDPVEYRIPGVNQITINNKAGLTFASVLRTILRQDPNIIMVGEIRDKETAEIAINAALTGHLVFSTLHTNDAAGAVTRLLDMGVEPFLIVSALRGVVAQRLVRKICPECKKAYTPGPHSDERIYLGMKDDEPLTLYKGEGCPACNYTGYKGRMAIHEVMPVYPDMKELIMRNANSKELFDMARSKGAKSIREDGINKVLTGKTTISEILRVSYGGEEE
jgi:type IV pilus assembly protein PilB